MLWIMLSRWRCTEQGFLYISGTARAADYAVVLTQKWQAWLRMGCLASEMESAALFIAGSFLHVRVGACFLVLANQEREKRGLPNVQVHDTTQAIATTVDAIRLLIQEDKDADRL